MMNRSPQYMEVETTGGMAKQARRANRRTRARVLVGLGLVLALFLIWFMAGRRACQEKFGTGSAEPAPAKRSAAPADDRKWIVNPDATTARVRVTLTGPGPLIIDGEYAATAKSQVLDLPPGLHLLAVEVREAVVQQYLTVHAGEEFVVTFDDATKDVRLERVPPAKR